MLGHQGLLLTSSLNLRLNSLAWSSLVRFPKHNSWKWLFQMTDCYLGLCTSARYRAMSESYDGQIVPLHDSGIIVGLTSDPWRSMSCSSSFLHPDASTAGCQMISHWCFKVNLSLPSYSSSEPCVGYLENKESQMSMQFMYLEWELAFPWKLTEGDTGDACLLRSAPVSADRS